MDSTPQNLHVIIVGCGIAGLAAARFLRENHDVTIYERAGADAATGGHGISLFPNSVKLLNNVGFDCDRAGAVVCGGFRSYTKTGKMKTEMEVDFLDRYGANSLTMKRFDFRDELYRLGTAPASELGVAVNPVKTVFHNGAVDLNPEIGEVTLADGSKDAGDVVIVADGVHSRLRSHVLGTDQHIAKKMGLTCFRLVISANKTREVLGKLPEWWEPGIGKGRISLLEAEDGTPRFITAYPFRHFEYMNLACNFPTRPNRRSAAESWYAEADRGELLDIFGDFGEVIVKLLRVADDLKTWDLQDLDPLPTFTKGRAILIGDAAHAMSVLQGQGANMAVEDAESFRLLTSGITKDEVPAVLKKIDSIRRPRTNDFLKWISTWATVASLMQPRGWRPSQNSSGSRNYFFR
ncbi:hypothetical protein AK830_g9635 [Neonectria ditissima]|uniref:FAD-binding domain-containing protein n=1 Tax=Neonectria ditissima TaxID=78410 RepID=A0A0P7AUC4_9HYPO|nr:hypothetical protein AK830_g9635 [Neonectria ditissima]